MGLESIKSALVLEDPEEALSRLSDALRSSAGRIQSAAVEDGRLRLRVHQPDAIAKERLSDMQARKLAEETGLRWTDEMKGRTVPYWLSDERPDAHGDIVRQNWLFDLFDKNPVSVFSHDWGGLPIGSFIFREVRKRAEPDYQGPALFGQDLFAPRSISEFADDVFKLVDSGFLRGASVGFVSDKVIVVQDDEERAALGLGRYGVILDQNHLLEGSPTVLGANPGAGSILASMARAKQRGALTPSTVAVLRELTRRDLLARGGKDAAVSADRTLVGYARGLLPGLDAKAIVDVEEPLLDRESWDRSLAGWKAVRAAPEEKPHGDEEPEEEPEEDPDEEQDGEEDGEEGLGEEQMSELREIMAATQEILASIAETLSTVAQVASDIRDMMEQAAEARADAGDPDGSDGDLESSVDVDALTGAGAAIDRLRQRLAG